MTLAVASVAALVLAVVPVAVDRWAARRASSASLVALALAALGGFLLLPVALGICLGLRAVHGHVPMPPVLVGAAALGTLTGGRALFTWLRVRRTWHTIGTAVDASRISTRGPVVVVPLATPTAFVAGPNVVVSTALLDALPEAEAHAVVAHEEAHLAGGHPRVALAAQALSRGVFRIPPARRAEARLRHELEVLADAEAARRLGDSRPVAAALVAVGDQAGERGDVFPFHTDPVVDRVERLTDTTVSSSRADGVVLAAAGLTGAVSLATVCAAFDQRLLAVGVLACTAVVATYRATLHTLRHTRSAGPPPRTPLMCCLRKD
jgi:Zn-dependent protease with chaperone function